MWLLYVQRQYDYIILLINKKNSWESVNVDFYNWAIKDLERVKRLLWY